MKRVFCLPVCVFAVLSVFLQGCSGPEAPSLHPLRIGLRSVVNSLDPLSENTVNGGSIYLNLYDALVQRDRALMLHPALAAATSSGSHIRIS